MSGARRRGSGWRRQGCNRRTLLAALAVALLLAGCDGAALTGTDLGAQPAPDFTLTDQRGQTVRLRDFRGKAVAPTFIYTRCPDICPATAAHLRLAYEQLPSATRNRVALLAVTVDPERDDHAARQAFSAQHGLVDNPAWFALGGTRAILEPIWLAYGIDPSVMQARMPLAHEAGAPPIPDAVGTPARDLTATLAHTDAVFLIDPEGRERVMVRSDVDPAALANNLEALTR